MATDFVDHHKKLINGYIRSEFEAHAMYDHFEESLFKVMLCFLGNILMVFDIYPLQCKELFSEDGTVFKRSGKDKHLKSFTFGCSCGWNEGVHKISIQSKNTNYYMDAFGITSNIDYFKTEKIWYGTYPNTDAHFYTLNANCLVTMNDNANVSNGGLYEGLFPVRTENDKISICFDANQWKVIWSINDKDIGEFKVIKDKTYYFFIGSGGYRNEGDKTTEYHLIVDY